MSQKKFKYPTGDYFNLPGQSVNIMNIIILEKGKEKTFYRKEWLKYPSRKFNAFYQGMNKAKK